MHARNMSCDAGGLRERCGTLSGDISQVFQAQCERERRTMLRCSCSSGDSTNISGSGANANGPLVGLCSRVLHMSGTPIKIICVWASTSDPYAILEITGNIQAASNEAVAASSKAAMLLCAAAMG